VSPRISPTNTFQNVRNLSRPPSLNEKAILVLLISKDMYSEVSQWLYKRIRVVRYYDLDLFRLLIANSTRMGPLEYGPRIEISEDYRTEERARIDAAEALMQLREFSRACGICTIRENVIAEPESQWTATFERVNERRGCKRRTYWKVALLPRDSLNSQQQQQ
jgi:hypothetical protein